MRDLFTATAERPSRLGYLEPWIFEYKFRDIFSKEMTHKSAQS